MRHESIMNTSLFDNRYRITELLGNGASASVYRAIDMIDQKEVAIKVFDESHLENREALRLFEREVRVVARLESHPNLLNYYGGSLKEGCRYLVMDTARGETLMHFLNRSGGKLPLHLALSIYSQLLSVLSYIHKRGIVHRDIKPHNIRIDTDGTIKLYDFGIAVIMESENEITGKAVGTVNYISPEQAKGVKVYPCSDLYSASIVLYEMLTGNLPFTSDKEQAEDRINEIVRKHFKETPIRPTHYNPNIPDAIEQIILKGMSKNLSSRFENADEILRYLALFYQNPAINFDFDLPSEEFDYSAALPKGTVPTAFKPKVTTKDATVNKTKKGESKALTRKKLLLLTLFVSLSVIAAFVIYFSLHTLLFYKLDERTVLTKGDLLYTEYSDEILDKLQREGYDVTVEYVYSAYYPAGTIFAQNPLPLSVQELGKNESPKLNLTVSTDEAMMILKDYRGHDYREVKIELEALGFSVEIRRASSNLPVGQVISTSPSQDEIAMLSDTVSLTVSSGGKISYAYMPNLLDKNITQAKSELANVGITYEIIYTDSDKPYGTVVYQSRSYGEKIPTAYTTVFLKVSNRIQTSETTDPIDPPIDPPIDEPFE